MVVAGEVARLKSLASGEISEGYTTFVLQSRPAISPDSYRKMAIIEPLQTSSLGFVEHEEE